MSPHCGEEKVKCQAVSVDFAAEAFGEGRRLAISQIDSTKPAFHRRPGSPRESSSKLDEEEIPAVLTAAGWISVYPVRMRSRCFLESENPAGKVRI
jgi:hypothetical protein